MRVLLDREPFINSDPHRKDWLAKWIGEPGAFEHTPRVTAFRRSFSVDAPITLRLHVSADERYELYIDGKRVGRGPERGDSRNWFFESYEVSLTPGEHVIVARTWWLGAAGPSPFAQMTVRHAFLLAAEGAPPELLNTGVAAWEYKRLKGYEWLPFGDAWGCGAKVRIVGAAFDWGFQMGAGDGWAAASSGARVRMAVSWNDSEWLVRPAVLPPMHEVPAHVGRVRHVGAYDPASDVRKAPITAANHREDEAKQWQALLTDRKSITIPPRTNRRVIVDLENYYCAYPQLLTTGGRGSKVRIHWAESLFTSFPPEKGWIQAQPKLNRNEVEGRIYWGVGDEFEPDGGQHRLFETLWWETGRYIEVLVSTADEPLLIESLHWLDEHYPYHFESTFESSDPRLAQIIPMALRTLEMCSHETYMDCPYFEQLQYIGDTRLQVLVTYATTQDDRLPRKAIELFDASRDYRGLTHSRYPNRVPQYIPPFALWWVAMVYDYSMWRDDPSFVRNRLPGVRAVIDTYLRGMNEQGLMHSPPGWNYTDWVKAPGWHGGTPPDGDRVSSVLNLQLALVLRHAAELEEAAGERELAVRARRHADSITTSVFQHFWDEARGMLADDLGKQYFSEHAQCLALLGKSVPSQYQRRMIDGLLSAPDLARTTIYFSHYLFDTLYLIGRTDQLIDRMGLWFELKDNGLCTTIEHPEPTRSDCHAWGAHPVYHYYASLLGIRPASAGFRTVHIEPKLGSLKSARGHMVHPRGMIEVDVADGAATVVLPEGLTGTFVMHGRTTELKSGKNVIKQ